MQTCAAVVVLILAWWKGGGGGGLWRRNNSKVVVTEARGAPKPSAQFHKKRPTHTFLSLYTIQPTLERSQHPTPSHPNPSSPRPTPNHQQRWLTRSMEKKAGGPSVFPAFPSLFRVTTIGRTFFVFFHTKTQFKHTFVCFFHFWQRSTANHIQRLSFVYALNIVFVYSGYCPSMVLRLCKCHYPLNGFILIICINMFFILQRTNIRIRDVSFLLQIHITNRLNYFCSNWTMVSN